MTNQVQKSIKSCMCCLQHEGNVCKAPIHLIVSTTPMDLLHVDFTSIKMIMEPNRLPKVTNVHMFQDHFTEHIMAYMTPNQTTKTITKFLYQGHISIFGALAMLLSDHGVNFMSSIIDKMYILLSVKKWTMPYHPQMNGLAKRSHQTTMQMIGKLGEDEKANWPSHLVEIVHIYNATWSIVMGYSQCYLIFGHWLRLPVDFYFPTLRSTEGPRRGTPTMHVNEYVATVRDHLRTMLQEAQAQSMAEAWRQKWFYNQKIDTLGLKPGNLIWVKADAFQEKRKIKNRYEDKPHEVGHQIMIAIPSYEVKDQHGNSCILHCNWLLLLTSEAAILLCVGVHQAWDRCTSPTQSSLLLEGVTARQCPKRMIVWQLPSIRLGRPPWVDKWEAMSPRASTEDGWRFPAVCSRCGCLPWQHGWQACVCLVEG